MEFERYVDFKLIGVNGPAPGVVLPVVGSRLMSVLHAVFKDHPGSYAIALPGWGADERRQGDPWRVLRVFARTTEHMDHLAESIESHHVIRDYAPMGYPRRTPKEWDGPWMQYRRYRVPSRKSGVDDLSVRRLTDSFERQLPYFSLFSKSTRQRFILAVEPRVTDFPEGVTGKPDSYGLSVASSPVCLPHIAI
jgi:CRISPR-associated endoribonuclease Cas6/Csy4 subtype I-F